MWPNILGNCIMADMKNFYETAIATLLDAFDE
jgi:hypothetical protein